LNGIKPGRNTWDWRANAYSLIKPYDSKSLHRENGEVVNLPNVVIDNHDRNREQPLKAGKAGSTGVQRSFPYDTIALILLEVSHIDDILPGWRPIYTRAALSRETA